MSKKEQREVTNFFIGGSILYLKKHRNTKYREKVITDLREINCSCIGIGNDVETSLLEEPKNWKTFLTFDEKYLSSNQDGSKKTIGITLGTKLDKQIHNLSKKIFF